ncbi:AAA family ATPase [Streptomyces sp. NPDC018019]|uniref:helix-turn-helix transcriptional regulator n=1 Tax=Streptomyces sp. NPDC018019 TaxID=3365030 RepID=UPI00378A3A49
MDGRQRTSGWSRLPRPASAGLVGRERERRLLDDLLAAGADGGAALLLWGEPGVGKTALLEYAAEQAGDNALWARGIESETVLPFAVLADLLLPFRSEFRELPGVQRAALESCPALSDEPLANPYAACMGALNVLAALGEKRPVAVLVDDLQWVDPSSQRVLLFIARRVAGERVALAFTSRDDHGEPGAPHSLPSVEVTGLSRSECGQLLRQQGIVAAPAVEAELVKISGGNPLALLEAAHHLTPEQRRGEEPMHDPPSLGRHLERAWSARIRALPEATRQALTVLAAHRSTELTGLCAALAVLGLSLEALCPAEEDGLVTATGDGLDFRHPVLRPLVLGRAPLAHRLAAFGALAEVTRGPLRAWYRAAAATGPDEQAAAALAEAAEEARRHSAPGVLPFTLAVRSDLEARVGHWTAGYGDATEALHWAQELGQISCAGYGLACLARLDALRGDRVRCGEQVSRARREVGGYGIGCLEMHLSAALGLAALAHGDHCAAADQLEQSFALVTAQGVGNPLVVPCAADLAEVQARAGNTARAAEVTDWLEERARATGLAAPEAAAARCRGLLAESYEAARDAFAAALVAHQRARDPFEQARTLLCEAELLRRYRRPTAARTPLTSALARFESLGAVPWARRAAGELAATGAPSAAPDARDGALQQLTPQEFQVARGLNNTEAAASLFVSRKTVEAHLTRVYRKLGVRSRTELARLMASGETVG